MIDSHAHLFDEQFKIDLFEVILRAKESKIDKIILPATTIETSKISLDLNLKYNFLIPTVGIHPHEVKDVTLNDLIEIDNLAKNKNVVAIGEIGIDYFYDFAPKDKQIEIFESQIKIAIKNNLPIIVHTRDSISESISIVEEIISRNPDWRKNSFRGVFHCFTGDKPQAEKLFSLGFLIGIGGMVTFKNSSMANLISEIGIANVILETDSPYLTPVPLRGKRNEPANVNLVANKISEILKIDINEVERITDHNSEKLFMKL